MGKNAENKIHAGNGNDQSSVNDLKGDLEITGKLKNMYDSYMEEPIPDHLLDILERIDAAEARAKRSQRGESNNEK